MTTATSRLSVPEDDPSSEPYPVLGIILHNRTRTSNPAVDGSSCLFPVRIKNLRIRTFESPEIRMYAAINGWPNIFLEDLISFC